MSRSISDEDDRPKYDGFYYLDYEKLLNKVYSPDVSALRRRIIRRKIEILERDQLKCVRCGSKNYLTIDRITSIYKVTKYKGLEHYRPKECQTLCVPCHKEVTNDRIIRGVVKPRK